MPVVLINFSAWRDLVRVALVRAIPPIHQLIIRDNNVTQVIGLSYCSSQSLFRANTACLLKLTPLYSQYCEQYTCMIERLVTIMIVGLLTDGTFLL